MSIKQKMMALQQAERLAWAAMEARNESPEYKLDGFKACLEEAK